MPEQMEAGRHFGLDLGGTNIKWVIAEHAGDHWTVIDQDEEQTVAAEGPDAVIARLATVATKAVNRCRGVSSVGIGVPGLYDAERGTTRLLPNLPGDWMGRPMATTISEAVKLPTCLINDARAFGLAELRLGAGRGVQSMVGLTLGTGVGGVMAVGGRVYLGHDGTAGEFGHQTLEPDGPICGCGNRGCLEAFARADRIAEACHTDSAEEAFERARNGDAAALAGIARVGRYLGIGIANMIVAATPDRVVIGGGIAAAFDLLIEPISREVRERVFITSLDQVEIVPAQLGIWAGAIGAAVHGAETAVSA